MPDFRNCSRPVRSIPFAQSSGFVPSHSADSRGPLLPSGSWYVSPGKRLRPGCRPVIRLKSTRLLGKRRAGLSLSWILMDGDQSTRAFPFIARAPSCPGCWLFPALYPGWPAVNQSAEASRACSIESSRGEGSVYHPCGSGPRHFPPCNMMA